MSTAAPIPVQPLPRAVPRNRSHRTTGRRVRDLLTFPLRAFTLFFKDRWGLSSLATERYDYVAQHVQGYALDIGCGYGNRFVVEFLGGRGRGIDVFKYDGLRDEDIVADMTHLPFPDGAFDSVTFIANFNHIPAPLRAAELGEAFRVLKPGGNVIITMGHPIAELLVHRVVWFYDRFFGTKLDMDNERGMSEDEAYYVTEEAIVAHLLRARFQDISRRVFTTQWGLNRLYCARR